MIKHIPFKIADDILHTAVSNDLLNEKDALDEYGFMHKDGNRIVILIPIIENAYIDSDENYLA